MNADFIARSFVLVFGVFMVNFGLCYIMVMFVNRMMEDADKRSSNPEM
jgi:hypothetical protein